MNGLDEVSVAILRALITTPGLTSTQLAHKLYAPKNTREIRDVDSTMRSKLRTMEKSGVLVKTGRAWAPSKAVIALDELHAHDKHHKVEWVIPNVALVTTKAGFYIIPFDAPSSESPVESSSYVPTPTPNPP